MQIKKKYTFKDSNQVWRILLSNTDKLVIETRNPDKKEAFFNCLHLSTGKKIFEGYQLDEKYWVGIETIHNDIIFFHKFTKPDMPAHKNIIAFDINTQKILWENNDFSFLFILDNKVYCYVQQFDSQKYFTLDINTGELLEELKLSDEDIFELNDKYESQKNYSEYLFPEKYNENIAADNLKSIVTKHIEKLDIVGDVEYTIYDKILLISYYSRVIGTSLINRIIVFDLETGKELFNEILNADAKAFIPDSFFLYKNILIMLKEKSKIIVCEIV